MSEVDLVHLSFLPPWVPGSYNRMVGTQVARLEGIRQAVLSFETGEPASGAADPSVVTVSRTGLTSVQRLVVLLPARLRKDWFNGIESPDRLAYYWHVRARLREIRPRLVVCYDDAKLGPLLRDAIDWPCRIILSQHGASYFLEPQRATALYSLRSFDSVCVLTAAAYRLERTRISTYEPLVSVIPNGIDVERFHPAADGERDALRARFGLPIGKTIVLLLGRLVPKKGAHALFSCWDQIVAEEPNVFLWVVGGGDPAYVDYLTGLSRSLRLDGHVRIEGAVHPDQTPPCYRASDVFVLPTLVSEGMALSVMEAMATGLACVVGDHSSAREHYPAGEVLIVPDPNLTGAFVEPVVRLVRDANLRASTGAKARAAAVERFSEGLWLERLAAFYRRELQLVG